MLKKRENTLNAIQKMKPKRAQKTENTSQGVRKVQHSSYGQGDSEKKMVVELLLTSSRRSSGRLTLVPPRRQSSIIRVPWPSPHGPSSRGSVSIWSKESIAYVPQIIQTNICSHTSRQKGKNPRHLTAINTLSENILAQKIINLKYSVIPYPPTLNAATHFCPLLLLHSYLNLQIFSRKSVIVQNVSTVTPKFTEFLTLSFYI